MGLGSMQFDLFDYLSYYAFYKKTGFLMWDENPDPLVHGSSSTVTKASNTVWGFLTAFDSLLYQLLVKKHYEAAIEKHPTSICEYPLFLTEKQFCNFICIKKKCSFHHETTNNYCWLGSSSGLTPFLCHLRSPFFVSCVIIGFCCSMITKLTWRT